MSKLQQIILNHLPKEREISFSALDTSLMNANAYGFNSCLQEIIKALPEIEKALVEEIEKSKVILPEGQDLDQYVSDEERKIHNSVIDDLLSSLTKDK